MNVLHVIPAVAPRYGGPSAALLPMCEALARLPGLNVEIATTDADGAREHLTSATMPVTPLSIHLFRRSFSERWKYSRHLGSWLRENARRYDLVHVHSVWNYPAAAATRAARRA